MTDMRKVIYHYCGVDALCKILESKTLRLSDCYFMNDYTRHGHNLPFRGRARAGWSACTTTGIKGDFT